MTFARPSSLIAMLALPLALAAPVQAVESGCQRVADAAAKRASSPAFHQRSMIGTDRHELLWTSSGLYAQAPEEPWKRIGSKVPVGLQRAYDAARNCTRSGSANLDGVAVGIYSFEAIDPMGAKVSLKIWIGEADGLPYREEQAGVQITTSYRDVKAPVLAK